MPARDQRIVEDFFQLEDSSSLAVKDKMRGGKTKRSKKA